MKKNDAIPGMDIVGVGLSTLDVLIRLEKMPTWENGAAVANFGLDGGGPVGTALVAAARLGARCGYVGTAGNDLSAELKLRSFRENGVDLSRLVVRDAPEAHVILCYVRESDGERLFAGLREWRNQRLGIDELDKEYITSARYLHLDGFTEDVSLTAARWMREAGKRVVYDGHKTGGPVSEPTRNIIRLTDVLVCGAGFLQGLTGKQDVRDAGNAALEIGPEIVVQTDGKNGCDTFTARQYFHTPAFQIEVIDTTGAGDVFHGAYLAGMLRGWDAERLALFSCAASALKCAHLGGRKGIPSYNQVIEFLREHHSLFSES